LLGSFVVVMKEKGCCLYGYDCMFGSLGCSLKCDMVCCRWFMVSLILLSCRCV